MNPLFQRCTQQLNPAWRSRASVDVMATTPAVRPFPQPQSTSVPAHRLRLLPQVHPGLLFPSFSYCRQANTISLAQIAFFRFGTEDANRASVCPLIDVTGESAVIRKNVFPIGRSGLQREREVRTGTKSASSQSTEHPRRPCWPISVSTTRQSGSLTPSALSIGTAMNPNACLLFTCFGNHTEYGSVATFG